MSSFHAALNGVDKKLIVVAEKPRDALYQLKPREMLHKCSSNCT